MVQAGEMKTVWQEISRYAAFCLVNCLSTRIWVNILYDRSNKLTWKIKIGTNYPKFKTLSTSISVFVVLLLFIFFVKRAF